MFFRIINSHTIFSQSYYVYLQKSCHSFLAKNDRENRKKRERCKIRKFVKNPTQNVTNPKK